jgi:glucokinase
MNKIILGIDVGGTKVLAAPLDEDGQILSRARAKTRAWRGDEDVFSTIVQTARTSLEQAGIGSDSLAAIGIGAPGPIDPATGYIIEAANMKLKDFPLGPRLSEEFGCPVVVENDVNAGVYGELRAGAARGAKYVLGVFVGTGIGGGIIIDGEMYRGASYNAGEVGHVVVDLGGPRCGCGNRGCIEALASRTAMTRDIKKAIKRGKKSSVSKMLSKDTDTLSGGDLKKAYEAGDKLVVKTVNRAAKIIGIGLGGLVNALAPEMIVLGGGVIEAMGEDFIKRIDRWMRKIAFDVSVKDLKIMSAELGDDAGVIGAAILAREKFIQV